MQQKKRAKTGKKSRFFMKFFNFLRIFRNFSAYNYSLKCTVGGIMREHFEILRDGGTFCFCDIYVSDEEGFPDVFLEKLMKDIKAGISDHVSAFWCPDEECEKIGRWNIVPYRYRLTVSCSGVCERLLFVEFLSSFDARFPGGVHVSDRLGTLYDKSRHAFIKPSFLLFPHMSLKEKRKLGRPISFGYDGERIILSSSLGKYTLDAEDFCKNYKRIADFAPKFAKKAIDKRGNI